MAYDPLRERVVMAGGLEEDPKTWEWDGSQWNDIETSFTRPATLINPAMAFDGTRGRVLLFGGSAEGTRLSDTWQYGPEYEIHPDDRAVGDFTGTGCTSFDDFVFLLEHWGEEIDGEPLGFDDFVNLLEHWGQGAGC